MKKGNMMCMPRAAESRTIDNNKRKETKKVVAAATAAINCSHIRKDKAVFVDHYQIGLHVNVVRATGIDDLTGHPFVFNRHYNVVYWVVPGEELHTRLTGGLDPMWNEKGMILLDNADDHAFLNVEVQRFNNNVDPGTSSGRVVVGRARVPFPKDLYRQKVGTYVLVRSEVGHHKCEGKIVLVTRLERIEVDSPYF